MNQILTKLTTIWRFNRVYPSLLLLLLVLNLCCYGLIHYQVDPELTQKERQFIELQMRARKARQVDAANESPRQAFHKAQEDLDKFFQRVPARTDLSALVGEIFSYARKAGLDIRAISYQPEKLKGRDLLEYPLAFSISGEYHQVKKLIHLVEQSRRLIGIDKLSLDRGSKEEGSVKLSISMTTYFRLEPV